MLVPQQQTPPTLDGGFLGSARRHLGWLAAPALGAIVLSVVGAFLWPDTFQSTATLRYQNSVDENEFEKSLNDRMQFPLSRNNLKAVIERHDLYSNDVKRLPLEDVIENMKGKIHFGRIMRQDSSKNRVAIFPIAFDYSDRFKAQKVVSELTALMVVANLRSANWTPPDPSSTDVSMESLEGAQKDLEESEALVTEFREKNTGQMPEQAKGNQEMMSSLRAGMSRVQSQIAQITREQAALQASLASELEKRRNVKVYVDVAEAEKSDSPKLAALTAQVQTIEEQIKALKVQYTENFPDVKEARQKLEKAKTERDALAKEEAAKSTASKQKLDGEAGRAAATLEAEIKRVQAQMEARAAEAERLIKEAADMDRNVQSVQQKLEGSTDLEKQYASLLKDRDTNKARYDEEQIRYEAESKARQRATAVPLGSPVLDVVDSPNLPVTPFEPNRGMIIGAGSVFGIFAGLIAAAVRGMTDRANRNLYGIEQFDYDSSPDGISRRQAWIPWAVSMVIGAGAMLAAIAHYYAGRN